MFASITVVSLALIKVRHGTYTVKSATLFNENIFSSPASSPLLPPDEVF